MAIERAGRRLTGASAPTEHGGKSKNCGKSSGCTRHESLSTPEEPVAARASFRNTGPAEIARARDAAYPSAVKLSDRIRRWWNPAEWRDEHPEISDGEGSALSGENSDRQAVVKPGPLPLAFGPAGDVPREYLPPEGSE